VHGAQPAPSTAVARRVRDLAADPAPVSSTLLRELVPELDTAEARERFHVVSLVDSANRPLTEKLLERPGAVERIRRIILDPELTLLLPFTTSAHEMELAVRLRVPVFGADPELA
jgi:hypothetical protein